MYHAEAADDLRPVNLVGGWGQVLLVSQFTLCASLKGNKPDFHLAMPPAEVKRSTARPAFKAPAPAPCVRTHTPCLSAASHKDGAWQ